MKLFSKNEVNLSRQFEFDFAKAICILGMVFVHCFEELGAATTEGSSAYYLMVTVLDSIFGAGTFMICMGLGIAYSWKENADKLIRRGTSIFLLGYLLNILRDALPTSILVFLNKSTWSDVLAYLLYNDILPFSGLALLLFGILKKLKFSDLAVFLTALGMSVVGSFARFIDLNSIWTNSLAGLFIGTYSQANDDVLACFPLCNWFLVVVVGYLYAKALRHCSNLKLYYAISFPVSAVALTVYMLIAIPNRLGMMNENIINYYQFSTPNILVLFGGAVLVTGLYHYISLLLGDRAKRVITTISTNINRTYCIHWVIIGWTLAIFTFFDYDGVGDMAAFIIGTIIFTVANVLAEGYARHKRKKKLTEKELT